MKIVSANYLRKKPSWFIRTFLPRLIKDEPQPLWLIREENQPPTEGKQVFSLKATDVRFIVSDHTEKGFGCEVVALCRNAIDTFDYDLKKITTEVAIEFSHNGFYVSGTDDLVKNCETLILTKDGEIFCTGVNKKRKSHLKTAK